MRCAWSLRRSATSRADVRPDTAPDCLTYATPKNLYGLQICFDRSGRVIETVDRRPTQPKYASLAYDPELSTLREPLVLIDKLFALKRIPVG